MVEADHIGPYRSLEIVCQITFGILCKKGIL